MTRINLISPERLHKVHLLAEYRELPRIFSFVDKHGVRENKIPKKYCLGPGHVLFFTNKLPYLLRRYIAIYEYGSRMGLKLNFHHTQLSFKYCHILCLKNQIENWIPTEEEINISKQRIIEKIQMKPDWYEARNWIKR